MRPHKPATVTAGLWVLLGLLHMLIEATNYLPTPSGKRQQLVDPLRGEGKTVELWRPLVALIIPQTGAGGHKTGGRTGGREQVKKVIELALSQSPFG